MLKKIVAIFSMFALCVSVFAKEESVQVNMKVYNEIISIKLPKTWRYEKPALVQKKNGFYLIEFLPKNQGFDDWKEMLTIQGFNNLAIQENMSSHSLEKMMKASYIDLSKEHFFYEKKQEIKKGKHFAILSLMGCKKVPKDITTVKKGEGEVGLYLFVKGTQDVYIIHKSWRTKSYEDKKMPIKQEEIDKWKEILINQTKFI